MSDYEINLPNAPKIDVEVSNEITNVEVPENTQVTTEIIQSNTEITVPPSTPQEIEILDGTPVEVALEENENITVEVSVARTTVGYTAFVVTGSPYNITALSGRIVLLVDTSAGDVTVNLATLVLNNSEVVIKKISPLNTVIIDGFGAELVEEVPQITLLSNGESVTLVPSPGTWRVI